MAERIKKPNEDTILVINMFSGKHLVENIAHEMINIFKTDNGKYYLYVPDNGNMRFTDIKKVLMVRRIGEEIYQVIGRARVKELLAKQSDQKELLESMKYGKKSIQAIMEAVGSSFNAYGEKVTFEASSCEEIKMPVYIKCKQGEDDRSVPSFGPGTKIIKIEIMGNNGKLFGESQRRYLNNPHHYSKEELDKLKADSKYQPKAYDELNKLFESDNYRWEGFSKYEYSPWKNKTSVGGEEPRGGFLSLIGKEDSELAYSDMLAYFLDKDDDLCKQFVELLLNEFDEFEIKGSQAWESISYDIGRERKKIDLLINTANRTFIIENKVNAELREDWSDQAFNGMNEHEKLAGGQLQDYVNKVEKDFEKDIEDGANKKKEIAVYIICPSWNQLYKDYRSYADSNGEDGLLRKVQVKQGGGSKEMPVPVISYGAICNVLKNHRNDWDEDTLEGRYFEDFIKMLKWQESHARDDQNQRFLDLSRKRFARAIKIAKSKGETAE